jgi:arylamine N-acetyltransferase
MDHPGGPSVEGLFALHRAHVERVAYTSLHIHLGQRSTPDPYESARRVVAGGSGYCYHLNGGFGVLLEELGYDVAWHRGRVYSLPPRGQGRGPIAEEPNHLAMTVEAEGILYYVDTGLGDALHEPLLLAPGETKQGPYTYQLSRTTFENGSSGWHFLHDPAADSFTGMVFEERIANVPQDFTARHDWMETNEESGFVTKFDVFRRDAAGVDSLRGCQLKRKEGPTVSEREITDSEEWFDALADVFGLRLPGVDEAAQEQLWKRVWTKHQEWIAAQ